MRVAGLPDEPGPQTVAWFRKRLLAEPDTPTIILSHRGLIPDPSEDAIWTALVADPNLPQIFMTTMGHYSHDTKQIEWVHGRHVLRIEFNYQNYSELDPPIPLWRTAIAIVRFYFDAGSLQEVEAQTRIVPHRPGPRGRLLRTPFSISDDISANR